MPFVFFLTLPYTSIVPLFFSTLIASFLLSILAAWSVATYVMDRIPIVGSLVGLQLSFNPGIAFGLRLPPVLQEFLIIVAVVLLLLVAVRTARTRISHIGFGLIIGGALANIADRAIDGFVTDYVQVLNFYIFNVADSCITAGVVVLLTESLMLRKDKR